MQEGGQGQVFFTATPAAAANSGNISGSHRKSSHSVQFTEATTSGSLNANRTSRLRREAAEASTSEEIVGTLDEAIGSSAPSKVPADPISKNRIKQQALLSERYSEISFRQVPASVMNYMIVTAVTKRRKNYQKDR